MTSLAVSYWLLEATPYFDGRRVEPRATPYWSVSDVVPASCFVGGGAFRNNDLMCDEEH